MTKQLNGKERLFVAEYLKDLNATQAAIRANYAESTALGKAPGWVGKSRMASTKPHVWDAVQKAKEKRVERVKVDADYVLERLTEIDQMDALDIMNDDLSFRPLSEWPKVWRQYISAFDVSEVFEGQGKEREMIGMLKKIKWPDKTKNLELLGKHVDVSAFKEKIEHSGSIDLSGKTDAELEAIISGKG